jgi:hypothetical protein
LSLAEATRLGELRHFLFGVAISLAGFAQTSRGFFESVGTFARRKVGFFFTGFPR